MLERNLVQIEVVAGDTTETQSGIQRIQPRITAAYERPTGVPSSVAAILMHPANDFLNHPLLTPLAERGICAMGLNSRYINHDAILLMERVIQDLGAGIKFLRKLGYEKVVLIGFSGGAALSAFYQAQATDLTVTKTPAGDPINLTPDDLPPADGVVLCAAHAGRSRVFLEWIDPSVVDERDAQRIDRSLNMYGDGNEAPYSAEFLTRYYAAQRDRRDRIEAWVWQRLDYVRNHSGTGAVDEAMVVHRSFADPRFLDLTIDSNDRKSGGIWGNARLMNYAANAIGRYSSLTSFLSQWASCSQADGPTNIAKTGCPVMYLEFTGDASSFPSTRDLWLGAMAPRAAFHAVNGADHYLRNPGNLAETADLIVDWVGNL